MEVARMTNAGNKKLLVVLLALALFACSVMALGGTFATQVDYLNKDLEKDFSYNKKLDYNVDIQFYAPEGNEEYKDFLKVSPLNGTVWCPGYTKIVYLKVTNNEAFPVDCELGMTVDQSGFGETLKYAVIYGLKPNAEDHPSDWKSFNNRANETGTLIKQGNLETKDYSHTVFDRAVFASSETNSQYFALAIHMDENATNQYQNAELDLTFHFRVNADNKPSPEPTDTDSTTPQ